MLTKSNLSWVQFPPVASQNKMEVKKVKVAIVNVNLEYKFRDNTSDETIKELLENVDMPDNYLEDSFEIVKIIKE